MAVQMKVNLGGLVMKHPLQQHLAPLLQAMNMPTLLTSQHLEQLQQRVFLLTGGRVTLHHASQKPPLACLIPLDCKTQVLKF